MSITTEPTVIEGTNIVDPRTAAYAVTVSERMGEVTVLRWLVKVRERVEPDTIVALVEDRFGEIEVKAGEAGTVAALMHPEGTRLPPHAVLCYIRLRRVPRLVAPEAPPAPKAPRLIAQLHPHLDSQVRPPVTAEVQAAVPAVSEMPLERTDQAEAEIEVITLPARRQPEQLASPVPIVSSPTRPAPAPKKATRGEPNTIGKKYRITPGQERMVGDMVHRLNRAPVLRDEVRRHKVRDSELIRALIEWFSTQSVEMQAEVIRANRDLERESQYGIGWPRPPQGTA